jgi:hypothetical protein
MKIPRKHIFLAAVVVALTAAGISYATIPGDNKFFNACMLNGVGTIRLIDKSLPSTNLMSHCTDKETEISWHQQGLQGLQGLQGPKGDPGKDGTNGTNGTNGKDGVSVTSAAEPAGANCAAGGVQLTAANGVNYVCNGVDGKDGAQGAVGPPGPPGGAGATTLFAHVAANGNLLSGNGVTSAMWDLTGEYIVTFNRDISSCVPLVTNEAGTAGEITATHYGQIGVTVETFESNAAPGGGPNHTDSPFYLAVIC